MDNGHETKQTAAPWNKICPVASGLFIPPSEGKEFCFKAGSAERDAYSVIPDLMSSTAQAEVCGYKLE